jgi:hydrogenase maturation factor HypF (carbamoyltransferase family)
MLDQCEKRLASKGVKVFYNKKIPTNDAGISVGQAIFGVYNA